MVINLKKEESLFDQMQKSFSKGLQSYSKELNAKSIEKDLKKSYMKLLSKGVENKWLNY